MPEPIAIPEPIFSPFDRRGWFKAPLGAHLPGDHRRWFARNRFRYPDNWEAIASAVKERAGWKCEACAVLHGTPALGEVLTVDHLDHTPANCSDANLIALCQRCHLRRQALRPRPASREQAIARLRQRIALDASQLELPNA